jgi:hypothetical protein
MNLPVAELYEQALRRGEGLIAEGGALCVVTAPHTGRSPSDKYVVRDSQTENRVWWSTMNQPMSPENFGRLRDDVFRHLSPQALFGRDLYAGADPKYRQAIRILSPMEHPVRREHAAAAVAGRARAFQARLACLPCPRNDGRPRASRDTLSHVYRDSFRRADHSDRRNALRG